MAKSYIDIVKYVVEAKFEIEGNVEKPDIIGAVFGQTEGLLGEDLDLRDLQKNGKIGRIEIESNVSNGKTTGKLILPSSLDRVETCVLGAAIESVDRVGPYETTFKVDKVEDTRNEKRAKVINRAKDLLKSLMDDEIPDSKEISDLVESEVKSSTVTNYGPENLPAGPDIDKSNSIIIVEGRADVVNLLKSDIANAIAVGGATSNIPRTLVNLSSKKETTVFTDGDHGGIMIIRNLSSICDVDYVARAPDGKEVEELTRKEIIKALRSKIPIEQAAILYKINLPDKDKPKPASSTEQNESFNQSKKYHNNRNESRGKKEHHEHYEQNENKEKEPIKETRKESLEEEVEKVKEQIDANKAKEEVKEVKAESPKPDDFLISSLKELNNTLRGRLYKDDKELIAEVPIRELIQAIQDNDDISDIVFDGIITQRLMDLSYKKGIKAIYGLRSSQISRKYDSILVYTVE